MSTGSINEFSKNENPQSIRSIIIPLITLILGCFMVLLDGAAVNVALPKLSSAFHSSLSTLQWAITGYVLATAAVIPLAGWLSDKFGAKNIFLFSIAFFTLGSLLCAMATDSAQLIVYRIIQGLGGGMVMPIAFAFVYKLAPPSKVGSIMGILGIPVLLAPALGPIIAGWLVDYATWQWIFIINIPVGLLALVIGLRFLPNIEREPITALDIWGIVLAPLAFAGDILLDGFVGDQIAKNGVNYPFAKVAPVLKKADMAFANLETPVSTRGKPSEKMFVFRSKPAALGGLVYAGIDAVSLANNHILDYGKEGMLDTLIHLDRYKMGHTGAGKNSTEAFAPYVQNIQGKTIAVLGVSRVLSDPSWYAGANSAGAASAYKAEPMLGAIRKSAKANDFTVVYIHWNQEFKDYPETYARELAKQIIDSGADMIIGAHSHCLMGIEYYKHKPIYYSLGNFVFNRSTRGGDKTLDSMLLNIEIKDDAVSGRITPVRIKAGQPNFMNEAYNKKTIQLLNKLSFNAVIGADGTVKEQ